MCVNAICGNIDIIVYGMCHFYETNVVSKQSQVGKSETAQLGGDIGCCATKNDLLFEGCSDSTAI